MQCSITRNDAISRMLRGALAAAATMVMGLVLVLGPAAVPAAAHAVLLESSPEDGQTLDDPPEFVELRFSEQVQPIDGAFQLFPSSGAPIDLAARVANHDVIIDLPADLADDAYALSWRVISADAHAIGGAVSFQVGDATVSSTDPIAMEQTLGTVEFAVWVLSALMYLGLLAMTGLIMFGHLVLRAWKLTAHNDRNLIWAMYCVAFVAALIKIPVTAIHSLGSQLGHIVQPGSWASQVLWQPVAMALVIGLMGAVAAVSASQPGRVAGLVSGIAAFLAVSSPVLIGHTQTIEPSWLMIPADIAHLVVGALWAGGILGMWRYLRYTTPNMSAHHAVVVVNRFSAFALGSVILLIISGGLMALLTLESLADILHTGYGQTLLIKAAVVAVVIVLAAWNRLRLLPVLEKQTSSTDRWTSLHRILGYEAILLVGVIALTGILTNQAPQREASSGGSAQVLDIDIESQGLHATGQFEPGLTGDNTLTFELTYDGQQIAPEEVSVEAHLQTQDLGPFIDEPEVSEHGDYVANITTPAEGEWEVWVLVRVDTFTQPRLRIPVTIVQP